MKRAILDILQTPHTYPVLMDKLEGRGFRVRGRYEIMLNRPDYHILLWLLVSEEFGRAMEELMGRHKIALRPTLPIHYMTADHVPRLPVAQSTKPKRKLHWLPVELKAI